MSKAYDDSMFDTNPRTSDINEAKQITLQSLKVLKTRAGYNNERLYAELSFADAYDSAYECGYAGTIARIADDAVKMEYISDVFLYEAESALEPLGEKIKDLTVLAVAHAHIDMNWMWRFDETVSITLSTFRTLLDLIDEFPGMTFAQSQASVYRIAELYDPEILRRIQDRVKEGVWETTVSSWVETDKNMPSAETLSRHILYAKRYMQKLFGIDPESLQLDFEPDTFGHNANIPSVLAAGGVKYYYHCRGYVGEHIYRWRSGKDEILVYREPIWYNSEITYDDLRYMPAFAKKYGIDTLLKVYGVGDHGGGPTRRDLTRLTDMMSWPLLPTIRFGTFSEFYGTLEEKRDSFPIVTGELNSFATGCYTTQTRIKKFNKLCERQLYESESFDSIAHMYGFSHAENLSFKNAWEHVLFNDFHDILPGSGTVDTREYALGRYQECLAITSSKKAKALEDLSSLIDTSHYEIESDPDSTAFGAGGGYCHEKGIFASAERVMGGTTRIYHLFNSTDVDFVSPSVITVWDYPGNLSSVETLIDGKPVANQLLDEEPIIYWSHIYQRIAVDANVPALGYSTILLRQCAAPIPFPFPDYDRIDTPDDNYVLENDLIKAEFDARTCAVVKLIDKTDGSDIISRPAGFFRLITEDATKEMTAWIVGRHMTVKDLTENVLVKRDNYKKGNLIQSLTYSIDFSESHLEVKVTLERGSKMLKYECRCDFHEKPVLHKSVPQLSAAFPCKTRNGNVLCDIPLGMISRPVKNMDMPCQNGVIVEQGTGKRFFVISNSKYGFRADDEEISLTLIRGSYEPDPLPDAGICEFDFALGTLSEVSEFSDAISNYAHPCSVVSGNCRRGILPENGRFFTLNGARISAVKRSEDEKSLIIRLNDCEENVRISFPFFISGAAVCDLLERPIRSLPCDNNHLEFSVKDNKIITLRIDKETEA